jgi:hypothetical protein
MKLNNEFVRMQEESTMSDLKAMLEDFFREVREEQIQSGTFRLRSIYMYSTLCPDMRLSYGRIHMKGTQDMAVISLDFLVSSIAKHLIG